MLRMIARLILKLGGWERTGGMPTISKAVVIAAPHTSNWDGFWALVYKVSIGLDVRFFAKHSLFWFPLGTLLRGLGGIPLNRARAFSAVDEAVRMFAEHNSFYFALAPEGTRSLTKGWKSGFYRIATEAGTPVIPGFLNYKDKKIGIGDPIELSGDVAADMQRIAAIYAHAEGRWPEKASPIQLRQ